MAYLDSDNVDDLVADIKALADLTYQPILTFDNYPISNSDNPVKSSGIYNAIVAHPNPNILDNWYFVGGGSQQSGKEFPINQRGQTLYTSTGQDYTIDRWRLNSSGQTASLPSSDGITIASGTILGQVPSINRDIVGKTVAWTILTEDGLATSSGIVPNSGSSAFATIGSVSCFLYVDSTNVFFAIENDNSGNKKIVATKLELGDTQTLAHQENSTWVLNEIPNYQHELAKCQRYFVKYGSLGCYGTISSGSRSYYIDVITPVPMARIPTISLDSMVIRTPTGYSARTPSGTATAPTSIQEIELRGNQVTFVDRISASAGDTNNIVLYYSLSNLVLSADL